MGGDKSVTCLLARCMFPCLSPAAKPSTTTSLAFREQPFNPLYSLFIRVVITGHLISRAMPLLFQTVCWYCRAMVLIPKALESSGGLVKTQCWSLPRASDSVSLGYGLRICFSNNFLGVAAGLEVTFDNHCCRKLFWKLDAIPKMMLSDSNNNGTNIGKCPVLPGIANTGSGRVLLLFFIWWWCSFHLKPVWNELENY